MISRYVLINTIDVDERDIEHKLKKHPNIKNVNPTVVEETAMADPIFENFNLVVKISAQSEEEINHIIKSDIQTLTGVQEIKISSKPSLEL